MASRFFGFRGFGFLAVGLTDFNLLGFMGVGLTDFNLLGFGFMGFGLTGFDLNSFGPAPFPFLAARFDLSCFSARAAE
ncbi:MAG: hypothetical protein LBJ64_04570 [Deltaproteobacteria bacterium]|nr:hypothetical protein [Deltaproteobacteria bacterium]